MKMQITGDYRQSYNIIKTIHHSKSCTIELVTDIEDGKTYVMRTFPEDKREIYEILQKCSSPYIPHIKDIFFCTDTVIIEEFIDGETLDSLITAAAITPGQASRYLWELLKAVDCLHRFNIIHRDIKPENIMIDKNNHIRLIDYGISRLYRPQEEKDTQFLGTVGYAAPEQFGYSQSDFRTDIFAIGMTCRLLNTACRPKYLLKKIEKKCTRFDPSQRYQSVTAIKNEYKKAAWRKRLSALLLVSLLCFTIVILRHQMAAKQNDITNDSQEQRLFLTTEPAPCMLLTQDSKKEGKIDMTENSDSAYVKAELTEEGLYLEITDSKNHTADYLLSNQYSYTKDYDNTSLTAEILFYDLNGDGQKEILAAVSDRAILQAVNGLEILNQNYMAGWYLYYQKDSGFLLAEDQLMTTGSIEVDGAIIPQGFWLDQEFLAYRFENGQLTELSW